MKSQQTAARRSVFLGRLPGRLPTSAEDLAFWMHDQPAQAEAARIWDVAGMWWDNLFSQATLSAIRKHIGVWEFTRRSFELAGKGTQPKQVMARADAALHSLCRAATFEDAQLYLQAIAEIECGFDILNALQDDLRFSINGVIAQGVVYNDTASLAAYARSDSLLKRLLTALVERDGPPRGVIFLRIKDLTEILAAITLREIIKTRAPDTEVILGDHGFENFSLHGVLTRAQGQHPLHDCFDRVIETRQDIPSVMAEVLGTSAPGAPGQGQLSEEIAADCRIYAPAKIISMRISEGRCYWAKCTYCTQNAKFGNGRAPSKADVLVALKRVAAFAKAGFTHFQFTDEALSPALLRQLSEQIIAMGLEVKWACRSKMEVAFDRALFDQLAKAGCYEVLYGLETIVPRLQKAMDKYDPRLDDVATEKLMADAAAAGVGLHINMIAAFPGETRAELTQSVDFLVRAGRGLPNLTFLINEFALFPETPMADRPADFGIETMPVTGDLAQAIPFRQVDAAPDLSGPDDVYREMQRAFDELGWSPLAQYPSGDLALHLYFSSGHGSVFKSQGNPFECGLIASRAAV